MEIEHINAPYSFVTYKLTCDAPTPPSKNGYTGLCGRDATYRYQDMTGEHSNKFMCAKHYKEWERKLS